MTSKENYPPFVNFDRYKHNYLLSFIHMILRTDFAAIEKGGSSIVNIQYRKEHDVFNFQEASKFLMILINNNLNVFHLRQTVIWQKEFQD